MVLYIPEDHHFKLFMTAESEYEQPSRMASRAMKFKLLASMLSLDEHIRRIEARTILLEQQIGDTADLLDEEKY